MTLPDGADKLTITEAQQLWVSRKKLSSSENSVRSYRKDLDPFVFFCDENNVERLEDLDEWVITQFEVYAQGRDDWKPITIKNKLQTLRQFLEFLGNKGAFDQYLHPVVSVPEIERSEQVNTEKWDKSDALPQIKYMRNSSKHYGTFGHAATEAVWFTGRRVQAICGLDLNDYIREPDADDPADGPYLDFKHRSDAGTRLKNDQDSEGPVEISEKVAETLDYYIARERSDKRDENGRQPLFTTRQGRASISKVRGEIYMATQPCVRGGCPHGEEVSKCEYRKRDAASKCPSSRSPHRLRTGSIQWQLDQGIPIEDVSDRVDASVDTIRRHYDVPDDRRKMEERRRKYTSVLEDSIDEDDTSEKDNSTSDDDEEEGG